MNSIPVRHQRCQMELFLSLATFCEDGKLVAKISRPLRTGETKDETDCKIKCEADKIFKTADKENRCKKVKKDASESTNNSEPSVICVDDSTLYTVSPKCG